MKRTALLRKTPLRPTCRPREQRDRSAEFASFAPRPRAVLRLVPPAPRPIVSTPKENAVRSEPYRRLVAAQPCLHCGIERHSQCCHSNYLKGMGLKTDDRASFSLCSVSGNGCHRKLDQGALFTKEVRRDKEIQWGVETQKRLRELAKTDAKVRAVVEKVIGL